LSFLGTHIAGIIAATTNNSLGVAGFAYNIKLWIGKTGDENAYNGISDIVSCIYDAQDIGASVINLSTGVSERNRDRATAKLLTRPTLLFLPSKQLSTMYGTKVR
jgi:subtilisin family serine protease